MALILSHLQRISMVYSPATQHQCG